MGLDSFFLCSVASEGGHVLLESNERFAFSDTYDTYNVLYLSVLSQRKGQGTLHRRLRLAERVINISSAHVRSHAMVVTFALHVLWVAPRAPFLLNFLPSFHRLDIDNPPF